MLVLDWGMNVYKMVKCTPVDRRLFVDFLLNYVARKLLFNYEILKKKSFNKEKRTQNLNWLMLFLLIRIPISNVLIWLHSKTWSISINMFSDERVDSCSRCSLRCVRSVIVIWAYSGRTRYQRPVTLFVSFIYCF